MNSAHNARQWQLNRERALREAGREKGDQYGSMGAHLQQGCVEHSENKRKDARCCFQIWGMNDLEVLSIHLAIQSSSFCELRHAVQWVPSSKAQLQHLINANWKREELLQRLWKLKPRKIAFRHGYHPLIVRPAPRQGEGGRGGGGFVDDDSIKER